MHAFVERLCEHAGVVRVGPHAKQYGDPFDLSVVYLIDGSTAFVKGLVAPEARRLTQRRARAIIRALRDIGLRATWERIKS